MDLRSDNITVMTYDNSNEVINENLASLLSKTQIDFRNIDEREQFSF